MTPQERLSVKVNALHITEVQSLATQKPIDIATSQQWDVVQDGMVGATSWPHGTLVPALGGAKYKIAGKTGTAQVFTVKQNESTKAKITDERRREHAWTIAYAPADDPKIAISVLVENGGFGASVAAPIARKVLYGLLGSLVYSAFGLLLDPGKAMLMWAYEIIGVLYTVYVTVATYRCAGNCGSPLLAGFVRISALLSLIALPVIAYLYYSGALVLAI